MHTEYSILGIMERLIKMMLHIWLNKQEIDHFSSESVTDNPYASFMPCPFHRLIDFKEFVCCDIYATWRSPEFIYLHNVSLAISELSSFAHFVLGSPGGGFTMHKENWEENKKDYDSLTDVLNEKKNAFAKEVKSSLYEDSSERMDKTEKRNQFCLSKASSSDKVARNNYDLSSGGSEEHKHGHTEHAGSAYDALPSVGQDTGKQFSRSNTVKGTKIAGSNYENPAAATANPASRNTRQPSSNYDAPVERAKTVARIKMTRPNSNGDNDEEQPEDGGHVSNYDSLVRGGSVKIRKPVSSRTGSSDVLHKTSSMLSKEEEESASAYDVPAAKPPKPRRQDSTGHSEASEPAPSAYDAVIPQASGINRRAKIGGDKAPAPAPAPEQSNYDSGSTGGEVKQVRRVKLTRNKAKVEQSAGDQE
jgi:hypothetical protein